MNNKNLIGVMLAISILLATAVIFFWKKSVMKKVEQNSKGIYKKITTEEAVKMMKEEKDYVIVDVRTKEEYEEGHIFKAISIPLDSIGKDEITDLPNKNQLVMVYCRSGNRSRHAVLKLIEKGYTNVVDFGGINTWNGEIVK